MIFKDQRIFLSCPKSYIDGGYPYKSDLFSAFFEGLSKKLCMNLADPSDVDVTASNINHNSFGPKYVVKNDGSIWYSQNLPNSRIRFDFKEKYQLHPTLGMNRNESCYGKL